MHIYMSQKVWAYTYNKAYTILIRCVECWKNWRIVQLLEAVCAGPDVISTHDSASNRNRMTTTLRLAYFVERFENQVSDVVGLLTLISSESPIWNCFTFVLKVAFIAG